MGKDIVILTDCLTYVGEHVRQSLLSHGVEVRVCDKPSADERRFVDRLHRMVDEIQADGGRAVIMPVFWPEVAARHKEEFPSAVIAAESEDKLSRLDNKLMACRLASSLGVLQPRIYDNPDEIKAFPVVFKRVGGHGGDSVYFPKNRATLDNLLRYASPESYLVTELIEGCDVSVDAVRWGDDYFYASAYKVLLPRAKGTSFLRESIDAPGLVETARRMMSEMDYNGICGFDFKLSDDGRAYFLECNPRFSGGITSAEASGLDLPWLLYLLASGKDAERPSCLKTGVRTGSLAPRKAYLARQRRRGKLSLADLWLCMFPGINKLD